MSFLGESSKVDFRVIVGDKYRTFFFLPRSDLQFLSFAFMDTKNFRKKFKNVNAIKNLSKTKSNF